MNNLKDKLTRKVGSELEYYKKVNGDGKIRYFIK